MLRRLTAIGVFASDYVNRNSASRPSNDSMVNIISIAGNDDIENRVNIVSNHNIF